jgi:hypothetical protein
MLLRTYAAGSRLGIRYQYLDTAETKSIEHKLEFLPRLSITHKSGIKMGLRLMEHTAVKG